MRIGISGAQCTGKTTLLKAISADAKLSQVPLLMEVVRSLVAEGVKINREADHSSQMAILERHYKNVLTNNTFFTDRCSLDAFVYATHGYLNGKFTLKEHWEHEFLFLKTIPFYTHVFLLPPLGFLERDGVRDTDMRYQEEIHNLFNVIAKNYGIRFTTIIGSTEERVEKINHVLFGT